MNSNYMHSVKPGPTKANLKDRNGESNVVALVRRTCKGQFVVIDGQVVGGPGKDGSDYYTLRIGADGVLYDNCGDYRNRGFKFNRTRTPGTSAYRCKHIKRAFSLFLKMVERGVAMTGEMIVYRPEVLMAQAEVYYAEVAAAARKTA